MTKSFAHLRTKWEFELSGSDPSAIETQLLNMTWDFVAYEVLSKALQLAPSGIDDEVRRSGLLFRLLERSFANRVLLFVRRAVDRNGDSISLLRTLESMRQNCTVMTRAALFTGDGLIYDYEPIRQQFYQWMSEHLDGAFCVPQELDWERHEERHLFIDRLTGVSPDGRSPSDVIPRKFFDDLIARVSGAGEKAKTYVDSHLAHAGSPGTRKLKGADGIALSIEDLKKSLRTFCEVVSLLKETIFRTSQGQWLAISLDDPLMYIDTPIVESGQIEELRSVWSEIERETQDWASWGLDQYEAEFLT